MNAEPVSRKSREAPTEDLRVAAVGKIWGASIPLFALSLGLAFLMKLVFLPLTVMVGLVVATCVVWYGKNDTARDDRLEALQARLDALEGRLENVETLSRVELEMAERHKT